MPILVHYTLRWRKCKHQVLVFTLGRPDLRTVVVGMYAFVGQHSTDWTQLT
jgi:hypothetical protein